MNDCAWLSAVELPVGIGKSCVDVDPMVITRKKPRDVYQSPAGVALVLHLRFCEEEPGPEICTGR